METKLHPLLTLVVGECERLTLCSGRVNPQYPSRLQPLFDVVAGNKFLPRSEYNPVHLSMSHK